ncbi:pirin family protein [Serratia sp. AKBS12]|uniref:pirin family protein n=1 Tax=Serratia sp. AKBS12 TaxID=2974597 RepID=UPI002165A903|nr:pirin family protein [Serratia sp. AKBS12]MCS3407988.1 pirin family protein [Serratia sp. AKBS12]
MKDLILHVSELNRPWRGNDPFLFCAYHIDNYPEGNGQLGIDLHHLNDRTLGNDFSHLHGYSMYHGHSVPGFPAHPHRGFETVTIVRSGYVDHADSLGGMARYGAGDVQWLTAGQGIQHAEMFPLVHTDKTNTLELFQIWLNLPSHKKMVPPAFKMLWSETIPRYCNNGASVEVIAGQLHLLDQNQALRPPSPPENSWAADDNAEVAIWLVTLQPGATLTLPAARLNENQRTLYVFDGMGLQIDSQSVGTSKLIQVDALQPLPVANYGEKQVQFLLLQGVPLNEPVVAEGPFVMNTEAEIHQAKLDYRRSHFGDWLWANYEPVYGSSEQRFARYPGQVEIGIPPSDSHKEERHD